MTNRFISIVDVEGDAMLVNLNHIVMIQSYVSKKRYYISYVAINLICAEVFNSRDLCIDKAKKISSLIGAKNININYGDNEDLLFMSLVVNKCSCVSIQEVDRNSVNGASRLVIRYAFSVDESPFRKNVACSEKFSTDEEAKECFNSIKKDLCYRGLSVIDSDDVNKDL